MRSYSYGSGLCLYLMFAFPCNATTLVESLRITANDAVAMDAFGEAVAISSTTAVIGTRLNDDKGQSAGAAYVFDIATGNQLFKLYADDAAALDEFGSSVAVSGTTALVGAYRDDDNGNGSGSAYVFDTTTGNQLFKLIASDAHADDNFGFPLALSGHTAVIGAFNNSDAGPSSGSAYIFDTLTGTELFKLTANDAHFGDLFGISTAVDGSTVVIGAIGDSDAGSRSGSAYIFDATTGNQLFKLTASDAAEEDQFGTSVAVSGNRAIVGARFNDDAGMSSGSAYIFDTTTGEELFKLTASDAGPFHHFGDVVAMSGDLAIVGAFFYDIAGTPVGAAYIFDVTTGEELYRLTASDIAASDSFGRAVGISGSTAIVSSRGNTNGVGFDAGAVYVFNNIPEPGSAMLLVAGGAMLLRQRN